MLKQELIDYLVEKGFELDKDHTKEVYSKEYQVRDNSKTKANVEYHLSSSKVSLVYTCMNIKETRLKGKLKDMEIKDGSIIGMSDKW